ncbi:MAG: NAD-dependent epimerase/dehydratase family protein [Bdellovibrionaceae bacterium]|nr:NAD-dependent epimerase/dehydratase family protein [Pseudobdellovibrionaceae bacterium]
MKVLVTGATGFLGGWLVRRLVQDRHEVRIIRRRNSDLSELEGLALEMRDGDVTNVQSLVEACADVDTVFHLAGLIAYRRADREAMDRINIEGTRNVINACEKMRVRKLVHLSSVSAIGASFDGKTPLNEDSPYNLHHLDLGYFETKHAAENLVREAAQQGRVDAVMINPSTIYGAGDAKKGSRTIQLKVAQGRFPFYTSGGVNVVAVEDVVDAILTAWFKARTGERYIISGENLLIRDLFSIIAEEAGVAPPNIRIPNVVLHTVGHFGDFLEKLGRKGPISSENAWTSTLFHWFDNSKAKHELGLNPRPAREAIAKSVHWIKEQGWLNPR